MNRPIKPNPFTNETTLYQQVIAWRAYRISRTAYDYMIDRKAARAPAHMIGASY